MACRARRPTSRDGSNDVLTQHVWGTQYVDELVQVGHNDDPEDAGEDDCETFYYACHNANFNVMGIVTAGGDLKERYEYTPYGQRSVFKSPGSNDPLWMSKAGRGRPEIPEGAPVLESQRVEVSGQPQPYGLCDVGHQGLLQDKEFGLIYNRARYVHPRLGRFVSPDPKGHADGVNPHASRLSNPFFYLDPDGRAATPCQDYYDDMWRAYRAAEELRKDIEEALEQLNNTPSGLDRFHEWEDLLRKQVEFLRRLAEAHAKLGKLHECCVEQWKKGQKRVAKPGFVPERDAMRNGCGPDEWPWRRTIPNRVFGWDFEPACNAHDVCDTVCGKDRVKCASAFRNDLYAECDRKERRGSWWWNRCRAVAILYADMVWDYGEKAYWKGQLEGCQCP